MSNTHIRQTANLRAMSFNIRIDVASDKLNRWEYRRDAVTGLIERADPDLLGLQEAYKRQVLDLAERLPGYSWHGPPRDEEEEEGERCPIFIKRSRLDVLEKGVFWLSETPEAAASRSWRSAAPRIVCWSRVSLKTGDRGQAPRLGFFNSHFDHWSWTARTRSAELAVKMMAEISGTEPRIFCGDLNSKKGSRAYNRLAAVMNDSLLHTESPPEGPAGTYRGFRLRSRPGARIDHVFASRDLRILAHRVLDDTYDYLRRPSDHMPVVVDFEVPVQEAAE